VAKILGQFSRLNSSQIFNKEFFEIKSERKEAFPSTCLEVE